MVGFTKNYCGACGGGSGGGGGGGGEKNCSSKNNEVYDVLNKS